MAAKPTKQEPICVECRYYRKRDPSGDKGHFCAFPKYVILQKRNKITGKLGPAVYPTCFVMRVGGWDFAGEMEDGHCHNGMLFKPLPCSPLKAYLLAIWRFGDVS